MHSEIRLENSLYTFFPRLIKYIFNSWETQVNEARNNSVELLLNRIIKRFDRLILSSRERMKFFDHDSPFPPFSFAREEKRKEKERGERKKRRGWLIFNQSLIPTAKFLFSRRWNDPGRRYDREKTRIACVERAKRFISRAQG